MGRSGIWVGECYFIDQQHEIREGRMTKECARKELTEEDLQKKIGEVSKSEKEGTWKLTQLKKLSFEEVKEEFDKLVKQTEISKKQRIDISDTEEKVGEVKEEEPVKRVGKRKKQKARKGISIDKSPQGDSETDKEESVEAINPTP
ncbi:hypothetical protein Tco_0085182 [Tanacetum coccineum]